MQDKSVLSAAGIERGAGVSINKVLRNTYLLLGMTLAFSAMTATAGVVMGISSGVSLVMMLSAFLLLWLVLPRTQNSASGLVVVFAFTGLMGASLGPMLSYYLSIPSGPGLVLQALAGTAVVFFGLSGYALVSRKDFSFMGGFLFVGLLVAIVAMIANIFLQIPAMSLAISAAVVLIMSGLILFDTSRIINGGETNYIRATVSLYLSIFNIFVHMLHLLGATDD